MDAVAFALGAEYQGTETIEGDDGPLEVPKYGGGILNVGDGDIDIAQALEEGAGTIVVPVTDQVLIDLLEVYPALEAVPVPDGATPRSAYDRRSVENLRHLHSLRELEGHGASKATLIRGLEAHDEALAQGATELAARIAVGDDSAVEEALGKAPSDGLGGLKKDDLEALAAAHDVDLEGTTTNADRIERLRQAGVRKED